MPSGYDIFVIVYCFNNQLSINKYERIPWLSGGSKIACKARPYHSCGIISGHFRASLGTSRINGAGQYHEGDKLEKEKFKLTLELKVEMSVEKENEIRSIMKKAIAEITQILQ
jgi:hypothetical protein